MITLSPTTYYVHQRRPMDMTYIAKLTPKNTHKQMRYTQRICTTSTNFITGWSCGWFETRNSICMYWLPNSLLLSDKYGLPFIAFPSRWSFC